MVFFFDYKTYVFFFREGAEPEPMLDKDLFELVLLKFSLQLLYQLRVLLGGFTGGFIDFQVPIDYCLNDCLIVLI